MEGWPPRGHREAVNTVWAWDVHFAGWQRAGPVGWGVQRTFPARSEPCFKPSHPNSCGTSVGVLESMSISGYETTSSHLPGVVAQAQAPAPLRDTPLPHPPHTVHAPHTVQPQRNPEQQTGWKASFDPGSSLTGHRTRPKATRRRCWQGANGRSSVMVAGNHRAGPARLPVLFPARLLPPLGGPRSAVSLPAMRRLTSLSSPEEFKGPGNLFIRKSCGSRSCSVEVLTSPILPCVFLPGDIFSCSRAHLGESQVCKSRPAAECLAKGARCLLEREGGKGSKH